MVTTSGNPESRSHLKPIRFARQEVLTSPPKHLKYYSARTSQSIPKPISEQQFAKRHPTQYKSLKLYSYVSRNKKPLSKIKHVIAVNQPTGYKSDSIQSRAHYGWTDKDDDSIMNRSLILPKIQFKEKKNKQIAKDKPFIAMYQSSSIAHEEAHSKQSRKRMLKDEKLSNLYASRGTKYSQKKYSQLPTEAEAEVAKSRYNKSLDKAVANPQSKPIMRSLLGVRKKSIPLTSRQQEEAILSDIYND